ncbi:MAG: hypothetical protein EOP50_01850 [Sphingobacteriales bacterium]|nr:MAG: hypothetical protein EOP50_01850 [Sphingobacteriales bacterium]
MKGLKPVVFFALCVLFAAALFFLVQHAVAKPNGEKEAIGYTMRNLIAGCLLATYAFFVLQRLLTGKVDVEYIVVMPLLILIASFLIGAVLHVFGWDISRNAFEQAGLLHLAFSLAVSLRLWRSYWLPSKKAAVHEAA